jgi:hypothetical protein
MGYLKKYHIIFKNIRVLTKDEEYIKEMGTRAAMRVTTLGPKILKTLLQAFLALANCNTI